MIQKIERLLDLMIAHYEKADNPVVVETEPAEETAPAAPKARKPRRAKDEPPIDTPAEPSVPETKKAPQMTEDESATKAITVATAYVHRFKASVPDGKTKAIALLGLSVDVLESNLREVYAEYAIYADELAGARAAE